MKKIFWTLATLACLSISWTARAQQVTTTINGVPPPYTFNGMGVSQSGSTFTFSGSGTVSNLTANNGGSGASSPSTYNGAAPLTWSYNTFGAAPALASCSDESSTFTPVTGTCYFVTASVSTATPAASSFVVFTATTSSGGSLALTGTTIADGGNCSSYISGTTLTLTASQTVTVKSDGTNIRASCTSTSSTGNGTPLLFNPLLTSVSASTTLYSALSGVGQLFTVTADAVQPFTNGCVLQNFYFTTYGAQPSGGTLVVSIGYMSGINGSITLSPITVTVAAGAAQGTFSDTTHTLTTQLPPYGYVVVYTNNAPAASSADLYSVGITCK